LTSHGKVYSWGCNDDGALGREDEEETPLEVKLDYPVTDISCGDSHSVFYNTALNVVYFCGTYRNIQSGSRP
jgi:regulator of chromosome condensation